MDSGDPMGPPGKLGSTRHYMEIAFALLPRPKAQCCRCVASVFEIRGYHRG